MAVMRQVGYGQQPGVGAQWESLVTLMGTPHVIREPAAAGGGF